jgi:NADPH2:quinone reductase
MRCWLVERIPDAGEMAWVERPDPVPGPDEYVVRVEAAGVNFADTLMARGLYHRNPETPFSPGIEVAGEIGAAGDKTAEKPGRRLCANYPTAYYALHHRAHIRPGETLLVHAAAGRVSSVAAQVGLAHGCRVIATVGSEEKLAVCRELGAEPAISYAADEWANAVRAATGGVGADVIFDPVGGPVGVESLRCLAWQGRLLTIGFASGSIPELSSNRLLLKEGAAMSVFWGEAAKRDPALLREVQGCSWRFTGRARVGPLIGGRVVLTDAPALARLVARKTVGKILLTPSLGSISD